MSRIRTDEEKAAARTASKEALKKKWMLEQEEKRGVHEKYMREALRQAKRAAALGETPIGCVIVHEGRIVGRGYNRRNTDRSTLSHAEISAIRRACRALGDWRLEDCALYVTLEPCQMCAGAIVQARIPEVFIGCMNAKVCRGVLEEECSRMMKDFFRDLRLRLKTPAEGTTAGISMEEAAAKSSAKGCVIQKPAEDAAAEKSAE